MKVLVIVLSLVVAVVAASEAMVVEFPLEGMVERSELIIIGKVTRVEEISPPRSPEGVQYGEAVATIEIEQILVGSYEKKQIAITYYPRLSIEAGFYIGDRAVFFINFGDRIVQGYAGKIRIEGDKVEVRHIVGEAKEQTLEGFIQRIKACAQKLQKK